MGEMRRLVQIGLVCVLSLVLVACGGRPKTSVVEQAIALQVAQVQQTLVQQLYRKTTPPPDVSISQVKVDQRRSLIIEGKPGYQIQGTYRLVLNFPGGRKVTEPDNAFDIYLQAEPEGQGWNLARRRPGANEEEWEIVPIPISQPEQNNTQATQETEIPLPDLVPDVEPEPETDDVEATPTEPESATNPDLPPERIEKSAT
jgi:hypothetical protein